jgi:hypothetical protein
MTRERHRHSSFSKTWVHHQTTPCYGETDHFSYNTGETTEERGVFTAKTQKSQRFSLHFIRSWRLGGSFFH